MPDAPGQSNDNSNTGEGDTGNGNSGTGDTNQGDTSSQSSTGNSGDSQFDPTALSREQLNQILEKNPEIWRAERLAEIRDKAKKFDDAQAAAAQAEQKQLEEQGKFKELSESQKAENEKLRADLKDRDINAAVTAQLLPLGVVDLEGALKLIDRSAIEVSDDGTVKGVDKAVEALKSDKAYLFNGSQSGKPQVGSPTNPGNGGGSSEAPKFKASQFRGPEGSKFYEEHREEILKAQAEGRIEQD